MKSNSLCEGNRKPLKKYIFAILLIITGYLVLNGTDVSLAVDRLGCLTCHGYPGFVKLEKPDRFKVLHIDEGKHLNSPHGKVDCRQCHTLINKIPHTGETGVECTTKCHLEDKEKIMAMKSSLSTFHKEERFAITRLQDDSSCRVCHPLYPHSKNIKMRAFINMHAGFMTCEVCHLKKENLKDLIYEWKSPEHVEFSGGPYGTYNERERGATQKPASLITRMLRIFSSQENQRGGGQKNEYSISRIAAFSEEKNGKRILMNTQDVGKAIKFKESEKSLNPEKKEKELEYFHKDIIKKEISTACQECHSPNGILDFQKLGFDEARAKDLQYLNIKNLVTKYDVFYLPNLFGH